MPEPQQSFDNHTRIIPAFHYLVFGAFTLDLVLSIGAFADAPSFARGSHVLTAVALIVLTLYARVFALTVQDRVIRLEMRQRLREVLPAALHARVNDFTRGQLVALRFASDGELAELAQTVLRDNLTDKKAIKQMIKTWNADHLRV
jgi:hypothetical protein